jgi:hypothetical protein
MGVFGVKPPTTVKGSLFTEHQGFWPVVRIASHTPSSSSECVPPPKDPKREKQHSLAGEGGEGPNSDDWTESLALCVTPTV